MEGVCGSTLVLSRDCYHFQTEALFSRKNTCECVSVNTDMMSCHLSLSDILSDIQSGLVARGHRQPTFSLEMDECVDIRI